MTKEHDELSDDLIEAYKEYTSLANRVKDLSSAANSAEFDSDKIRLYKELILSINKFDDHIKMMIVKFPVYYTEKEAIDNLILENKNFIIATMNQLKTLTNALSN